ncbi:ABC transporter substrate-binding protein [Parvularcula marina]|uniref:ABC transporter substrate-binding protein n=1 Tax=Parvularcula marina TaxID=2292771 RepID=A0A371RJY6_9PROT|nr:ABC transporter substrate-binding protein [Parvularcula marina]RFB05761.1 ABC transporter substrate-binding protein [Parvularcula marina]
MSWLAILYIFLAPSVEASPPQRIVSLNLCTDQLLIELADRERIAGVSYWAVDPRMAAYAAEAKGLRTVRGSAEEVIGLEPDLVLAGTFSTRETVSILTRLGYQVVDFTPANSIEDIATNLRTLGAAISEEEKAEEIIARMEARLATPPEAPNDESPLFATYDANGWSTGSGTLTSDIAARAGYRTLGDELGFFGSRRVNLETLLTVQPDVIDLGDARADAPALASEALKHPALGNLLTQAREVKIPGYLTACGTPKTVEAVELLIEAAP